ncbi:DUF3000 domain-containing protein [Janibacter sp. YIM B02568]|uniref:DUF3000 domain-containing protein n=1 Tax=Janibacter endophyticus TaxID=2806261 RepID=UPI00194DD1A4|nr:DUF3000 domain-containing protein [Janibacter endophyticus]MBM6546257.1 DUF3000 domain-containing protein [Janibacter endophyticus]
MASRPTSVHGDGEFSFALAELHAARVRPEVRLTEVPAPTRIAPDAVAMTGDVLADDGETELATGRFVLLHDIAAPEPWEGPWRVVTYARAELEAEVAGDPVLGEVGWSWLLDALRDRGIDVIAEAGTVTRVVSESFGDLDDRPATVEMEIRASWSPADASVGAHLEAWIDLLCTIGGLPPLPEGVVALPGRRR